MRVTILGPNLPAPACHKGMMHVHADGCRDANNRRRYGAEAGRGYVIDADSVHDVLEFLWADHASDYGYEPGTPEYDAYLLENLGDTHFHACTSSLT
jgi:hypothetical protein